MKTLLTFITALAFTTNMMAVETQNGIPLELWAYVIDYHNDCCKEYLTAMVTEDYDYIEVCYGKKIAAAHILEFFSHKDYSVDP